MSLGKMDEDIFQNEQPPCGQCDFAKQYIDGCFSGFYVCIHCGFRISEEEYKRDFEK